MRFADFLKTDGEGKPKGQRTRLHIIAAASVLLDEIEPADLLVSKVCAAASISNGTFYIYFKDRHVLFQELLEVFISFLQERMKTAGGGESDRIRSATAAYFHLFKNNRGLMRCLLHHHLINSDVKTAFHRLNKEWIDTVVRSKVDEAMRLGKPAEPAELKRRAYALGGMVDQYLSNMFLSSDPDLLAVSTNDNQVIETLTEIWRQGMDV